MSGSGHSGPDFVVSLDREPSHHLALENEQTRVFQVEAAPHASTLLHQHDRDYIFVSIGAAEISNAVQGQPPLEVSLGDGDTRFVHGAFAHVVTNRGATPFRNVTIEIKRKSTREICGFAGTPACATTTRVTGGMMSVGPASAALPFRKETLFETDAVRASRIQLAAGGTSPEHEDGSPRLLVAVSDLELTSTLRGGETKVVRKKAGDFAWLPAEGPHSVHNAGAQTAQFVVLEFK